MNQDVCEPYISAVSSRLKKLTEANHSLAEIEILDGLFPRLLDLTKDVMAAEAASLMLYNPKLNQLEFASIKDDVVGDKEQDILKSSVKLKMGEGIAGWVAENREPVIIKDAQKDPRFSKRADKKTGFSTRTMLCVPLIHRQDLLGVLNVLNSRDKPFFEEQDLGLLESFADLAAVAITRSRLLEARVEQERFRAELKAAAQIQKLFWPELPAVGDGSHLWAVSEPAASVGGDLYDVIPMPDESWLLYVADVSGKGLPAALLMAALSTKIQSEALLQTEVDELLDTANKSMYDLASEEGFFATIALARYWTSSGKMQLTLGGHLPPLWIADGTIVSLPQLEGISLGVTPDAHYEKKEISISPGESILFFTDGIIEAENESHELFSNDRLAEYIKKTTGPPWGEGLLNVIRDWRGNASVNDDLTILEIWRDR
ncbi:MAG: SpoIIE family protein phosphatase [Syntrophobacterales bacterium]|jgi:serine phosphatase RsbU (regulator of sigma subunit)